MVASHRPKYDQGTMNTTQRSQNNATPIGDLLRTWRQRRRLSQLELACAADISARHVSFMETGRSMPSREMLLRLAERLAIPLRERNPLLLSAGYAPVYSERRLDDPALDQVRKVVDQVLAGHQPYPALAVDRHWTLISANASVGPFLEGAAPHLLQPPVNVLRLGIHPEGLAPRIENFVEWRAHVITRLHHQIDATADPVLVDLLAEFESYPWPPGVAGDTASSSHRSGVVTGGNARDNALGSVVVPLKLRTPQGSLSFFSTTTIFGTPLDITLAELAIESFFPADAQTARMLADLGKNP
jgi:transcriptional regulator with XRE-family HTH domain